MNIYEAALSCRVVHWGKQKENVLIGPNGDIVYRIIVFALASTSVLRSSLRVGRKTSIPGCWEVLICLLPTTACEAEFLLKMPGSSTEVRAHSYSATSHSQKVVPLQSVCKQSPIQLLQGRSWRKSRP